jgi:hypothetical protein
MDEIESHESETVKKPKSWRRDLEAGEMTAVVASSHIHHYSSLLVPPRLRGRGKQSVSWVTRTIWPG